jgi:hypothetical protein
LRFIYDMGAAYRASKRTKPLMDVFSFHPYPRSSLDSLAKGLEWPMAGYANLNRVKQALWDAFNGTRQKTTVNGLGIMIDEVGWQVRVPADSTDYTGTENVPVTTEAHQAQVYGQLVRAAVCDSSVKSLLFMPFIDETDLAGFQSGLERADGTKRPAYDAVKSAIAATHGRCLGRQVRWSPVTTVMGAHAYFRGLAVPKTKKQRAWSFGVRTAENARYTAAIVRAPSRTTLDPGTPAARPLMTAKGLVKANWTPLVQFPRHSLPPGRYEYKLQLSAVFNPLRSRVFVSRSFVVHRGPAAGLGARRLRAACSRQRPHSRVRRRRAGHNGRLDLRELYARPASITAAPGMTGLSGRRGGVCGETAADRAGSHGGRPGPGRFVGRFARVT